MSFWYKMLFWGMLLFITCVSAVKFEFGDDFPENRNYLGSDLISPSQIKVVVENTPKKWTGQEGGSRDFDWCLEDKYQYRSCPEVIECTQTIFEKGSNWWRKKISDWIPRSFKFLKQRRCWTKERMHLKTYTEFNFIHYLYLCINIYFNEFLTMSIHEYLICVVLASSL